jgi:hypothetical protein
MAIHECDSIGTRFSQILKRGGVQEHEAITDEIRVSRL